MAKAKGSSGSQKVTFGKRRNGKAKRTTINMTARRETTEVKVDKSFLFYVKYVYLYI